MKREMESGEPEHPGERAPAERTTPDDLRVTSLDGAAPAGRPTGRAWRWGLRLGGLVALLSLIAIAAVALSPLLPRPAPSKPAPLDITALRFPEDARSCVMGGAWSPDSAQIAIMRSSGCDTKSGPTVLTFNGTTGALLNAFPLEAAIRQTSATPGATAETSVLVDLESIVWSPNGLQVAIPFLVFPASETTPLVTGPMTDGLALLTVRGQRSGDLSIWAYSPPSLQPFDPLTLTGPHTITEWDLWEGGRQSALTVSPAYAYGWGADGALEPVALSGGQNSPSSPAGAVAVSGGFSLWRSGRLWAVNALTCAIGAEKFLPQPYIWLTLSTMAWSPDGRYLAQVSATGRYNAPGAPANATPEPSSTYAPCSEGPPPDLIPLAPARDAGLRATLALAASGGNGSVELEWRPDGRRLAALTFNVGGTGSAIALYDCRTGVLLRRYTAGQFPINGVPGTGPAKNFDTIITGGSWSPDGRRLLIEASGTGAAPFILGPGALGA